MNWLKHMEARAQRFTIIDFGVFKICMIAFTLLVAKLLPVILTLDWYWYALVFAVAYAWMLWRMFGGKR